MTNVATSVGFKLRYKHIIARKRSCNVYKIKCRHWYGIWIRTSRHALGRY